MIKTLWFVVTAFGQVVVTMGPLTYDMEECLSRGQGAYQSVADKINSGMTAISPNGQPITLEGLSMGCHMLESKPEMGSDFGG